MSVQSNKRWYKKKDDDASKPTISCVRYKSRTPGHGAVAGDAEANTIVPAIARNPPPAHCTSPLAQNTATRVHL